MSSKLSIAIICLIFLVLPSCVMETNNVVPLAAVGLIDDEAEPIADQGDFKVVYLDTSNEQFAVLKQKIQDSHLFEDVAQNINSVFALPYDIEISFQECGEEKSYYDAQTHNIIVCYDLINYVSEISLDKVESEEELNTKIVNSMLFIFFHQAGHALSDAYGLELSDIEIGQLASIMLVESGEPGENSALDGAAWILLKVPQSGISDLDFIHEHDFYSQKEHIICWVYGKNPAAREYVIERGYLPEEDAVRCTQDYLQAKQKWENILSKYIK